MNKIAIITDSHFGARGDRQVLLDHFERFYSNIFFPEIEKRKIHTVWHLGDLVDRRKFVNFNTLETMKNVFLDPLLRKCNAHFVMGNHDQYYKNKISPNALDELLKEYTTDHYNNRFDCHVYTEPQVIDKCWGDITVIPWICEQTREAATKLIQEAHTRYCFGHLEMRGHQMSKGQYCHEGDDLADYSKFDMVLTGHFHHKSSFNNLHYLGAPYEMTWVDYEDSKGFHILDLDTGELEFIENPYRLFYKFVYNDTEKPFQKLLEEIEQKPHLQNGFVKVIVRDKTNEFLFDQFIDKLNAIGVSDLQVVEDHFHMDLEPDDVIIEQAQSTIEILHKYVQNHVHANVDIQELETLLKQLYDEAEVLRI